jgi:proteasome lid subunit RPN8/RPN11
MEDGEGLVVILHIHPYCQTNLAGVGDAGRHASRF